MKTLRLILLACAFVVAGCATMTKDITKQVQLVRDSFNSLLPPDFNGPVHLKASDMYVTLSIDATDVHKLASGEWSWSSVSYKGTLTVPWFAGLTYTRNDEFVIGAPGGLASTVVGTVETKRPATIVSPGVITTTVTTSAKP